MEKLNQRLIDIIKKEESDDRTIVGVDRNSVDKMEKEFANLCNNPSKIKPAIYFNMQPYE